MYIKTQHLIYFSPTETTKQVLEAVSRGIGIPVSAVTDITLPETREDTPPSLTNEIVLLGAPVYGGRVQKDAARYFSRIAGNVCIAVLVALYGNREYEDALIEMKDLAVGAGLVPAALGAFVGEHSFSSEGTPIGINRPDNGDIAIAEGFGRDILQKIEGIESPGALKEIPVPGSRPYRDHLTMPVIDFIHTSDACIQCNTCVESCPVAAIERDTIATDFPSCIFCCACIKKCPEGARSIREGPVYDVARKLSQTCTARKEPELYF